MLGGSEMRTLKHRHYIHRFKQFEKTFKTIFPVDSEEYDIDIQAQFNKVLAKDDIAPIDWWTGE